MNRVPFALLFVLLLLASCQQMNKRNTVLTTSNLPSQFFTINTSKDTSLRTAGGAMVFVPKGSLLGKSTSVKIEVKEAYSVLDMVKAGLATKAGEDPLSSGGMIYVNAVGEDVTVVKALSVAIPTNFSRSGMQVYGGSYSKDSNLTWANPKPLLNTEETPIEKGEKIFTANCASCHDIGRDATGPALAYVFERRDWDWIEHYTKNPAAFLVSEDYYALCLHNRFHGTMTSFPNLTPMDFHALHDYIENESKQYDPAPFLEFSKHVDSCIAYYKAKDELEKRAWALEVRTAALKTKRQELIAGNGNQVSVTPDTISLAAINNNSVYIPPVSPPKNMVQAMYNTSTYYQFTIEKFGWYNVDILMKGLPGFEESELMVRIVGQYKTRLNVYMLVPTQKILLDGGLMKGKTEEYAFYTDDGRIPLPQGTNEYIIASGEVEGKVVYGAIQFVTAKKQALELELQPMTKEEMNTAIEKLELNGVKIKALDSKNAETLRKNDAEVKETTDSVKAIKVDLKSIENLKPKNFDCACGRA